jgi:hypothetical protein
MLNRHHALVQGLVQLMVPANCLLVGLSPPTNIGRRLRGRGGEDWMDPCPPAKRMCSSDTMVTVWVPEKEAIFSHIATQFVRSAQSVQFQARCRSLLPLTETLIDQHAMSLQQRRSPGRGQSRSVSMRQASKVLPTHMSYYPTRLITESRWFGGSGSVLEANWRMTS